MERTVAPDHAGSLARQPLPAVDHAHGEHRKRDDPTKRGLHAADPEAPPPISRTGLNEIGSVPYGVGAAVVMAFSMIASVS